MVYIKFETNFKKLSLLLKWLEYVIINNLFFALLHPYLFTSGNNSSDCKEKDTRLSAFSLWLRERDSNPRPLGYEPNELPAAPPRVVLVPETGIEPVRSVRIAGF